MVLVSVSVVVVVTGLRVVVSCDVLVVLCVALPLSDEQAESDMRATAARHGRIIFFIYFVCCSVCYFAIQSYYYQMAKGYGV